MVQVTEAETAIGMSFPLPLVLFTSMTKRALQRSSSSISMVGGSSTFGLTTVGTRLCRRLISDPDTSECDVKYLILYFSSTLPLLLKIVPFRRVNSPYCVVVMSRSTWVKVSPAYMHLL